MTDIVKKLRSPIDEKEDYFISQWPGEEPKTHDAVRFQAANDIERLRAALRDISLMDKAHEHDLFSATRVASAALKTPTEAAQPRMERSDND